MLVFPGMIAESARQAGMKVPADPDGKWSPEDYPHFHVFCNMQLCRSLADFGAHWDNAKVIAALSDEDVRKVTKDDLISRGFVI